MYKPKTYILSAILSLIICVDVSAQNFQSNKGENYVAHNEIHPETISKLEMFKAGKSKTGKGALIGALGGLAIGAAIGSGVDCYDLYDAEVSEFKCTAIIGGVGAVGGGLIGAIIGSLQKSDHIIEMDIEEVSIQLLPQNQNGLGLSLVFEF